MGLGSNLKKIKFNIYIDVIHFSVTESAVSLNIKTIETKRTD